MGFHRSGFSGRCRGNFQSWRSKAALSVVVVYAAQDQVYAEPVFAEFQKETGIKVKAVYDSEAVKTVGLANRLLAERSHPQCDMFLGQRGNAHAPTGGAKCFP